MLLLPYSLFSVSWYRVKNDECLQAVKCTSRYFRFEHNTIFSGLYRLWYRVNYYLRMVKFLQVAHIISKFAHGYFMSLQSCVSFYLIFYHVFTRLQKTLRYFTPYRNLAYHINVYRSNLVFESRSNDFYHNPLYTVRFWTFVRVKMEVEFFNHTVDQKTPIMIFADHFDGFVWLRTRKHILVSPCNSLMHLMEPCSYMYYVRDFHITLDGGYLSFVP